MNYYERLRKKMIGLLGGQCWMCGSTYKLEFHHVHPKAPQNRSGGKGNLLHVRETVRNGGRVWLLCFRCHTLIDPDRKQYYPGDVKSTNAKRTDAEENSHSKPRKETTIANPITR